jgi:hypothetical protein
MRQLLVSNLTQPVFAGGALAAGAVTAVIKTASGFTQLAPGDTYSTSQEIQFVQGTPTGNIFSPWINGKDIISWAGRNYAAQTAQISTINFGATAFTVAGTATIKFTEVNNGVEQFRRKTYVIPVTTNMSTANFAIAAAAVITADIAAGNVPWLATAVAAGNTLVVTGTTFSLSPVSELSSFRTATEGIDGSNGANLVNVTATASPSLGSGDADVLLDFEQSLQGNLSFYNRVRQPNTPPTYINPAANYDLYSISWLNPVVGQIKGVDNHRNLTIAMVDGLGVNAVQGVFEATLNGYLASVPGSFAAVSI